MVILHPNQVVFVHDPDSVTRVSDGLIAIQCQKHIDLLDALTGRWLWRQAAPLDTQDILYMNNLRLSSF
ncbi:hypothetical protein Pelo_6463 [Pelomyxa schiedti]|nr:hypothetical protein Pelo_6463 [Pelomyxa schiedti]